MATWVIGDVQGCADELDSLLRRIEFDRRRDRLWFAGDLVNRGPASLAVLRRVFELRDVAVVVLGNHDLHLLACHFGARRPTRKDTFGDVLAAPDAQRLCDWLRSCKLAHFDAGLRAAVVHAGVAPDWDADALLGYAAEVEGVLGGGGAARFLGAMYGDEPRAFDPALTGLARLRAITNVLTRMRLCYPDGSLDLDFKGPPTALGPEDPRRPWFELARAWPRSVTLAFGHWASLGAGTVAAGIEALDSGCVWGGALTALRLEDRARVSVPSRQPAVVET